MKLLAIIYTLFVIYVKEMALAFNVKTNSILELIVVIYVINAQMQNAILVEIAKMKLQIVKIISFMEQNVIKNVILNVINVIEMELALLVQIIIIGVLIVINNAQIVQEELVILMEFA